MYRRQIAAALFFALIAVPITAPAQSPTPDGTPLVARAIAISQARSDDLDIALTVATGSDELVSWGIYRADPTAARVRSLFVLSEQPRPILEGRVTCAARMATQTDRPGVTRQFGALRVKLDQPVPESVRPAPLGGRIAGRVTMVDSNGRFFAGELRGETIELNGFGSTGFPVIVPASRSGPFSVVQAVFDGDNKLAGFAVQFTSSEDSRGPAWAGLAIPMRSECFRN